MATNGGGTPGVTVVIPTYNAHAWLQETLRSVLRQTIGPHATEVVVVDDGSTDATVSIAGRLLAEVGCRHRILSVEHGGPSRARNVGWRVASAGWIQFLDADDVLHPRKVEIQLQAAQDLAADVAVVYSDWQRIALVGGTWQSVGSPVHPALGSDPLAALLESENFVHAGAQLIRRTWLERVGGFDERHWLIEDVDLALRLTMAGAELRYIRTDRPMFFYRQLDGSLSRRDPRAFAAGCVRNAELVETHWRAQSVLTPSRAETLARVYYQAARTVAVLAPRESRRLFDRIDALVPGFVPREPARLRRLSQLVGYRRAERVAAAYRWIKGRMPSLERPRAGCVAARDVGGAG